MKVVALFELTDQRGEIRVVEERHYRLVPASQLDAEAIRGLLVSSCSIEEYIVSMIANKLCVQ